ncbi:MAG: hypothetical protein R3229_15620 [Alphaproteobacteria bacterium]|nr:hypothetical protein [Alphaproteobacteria bacterium]
MIVTVECYAGHRGEETPRRIRFDSRAVEVAEIVDAWHGPDHRYFKVLGADGGTYLLRHDERAGAWELVQYIRAEGGEGEGASG